MIHLFVEFTNGIDFHCWLLFFALHFLFSIFMFLLVFLSWCWRAFVNRVQRMSSPWRILLFSNFSVVSFRSKTQTTLTTGNIGWQFTYLPLLFLFSCFSICTSTGIDLFHFVRKCTKQRILLHYIRNKISTFLLDIRIDAIIQNNYVTRFSFMNLNI